MKILAIGPIPGPITGMAIAFESFVVSLKRENAVEVIDLSKTAGDDFLGRLLRVGQGLRFAWLAWKFSRSADVVYFKISESLLGNMKDIAIYLACVGKLSRMTIHLNGGAGMRELLRPPRKILRALNRFFLRRVHRVVVLGPRLVDIFEGIVPRDRIATAANFAAGELFISNDLIDRKFSNTRPLRLLFLSNLLWGKGHEELVAAVNGLAPNLKRAIHLDIAGAFELPRQSEAFLESIAGQPNVTYHGVVSGEARVKLFGQAHVFCLPTYYPSEGQPLSILEAYASGCVVLTTDHSGIFDTFSPGRNGYGVAKRSILSIQEAIAAAVAEPEQLLRMARNNRLDADNYAEPAFNQRLQAIVIDSLQQAS